MQTYPVEIELKINTDYIINKIESEDSLVIERLRDMGAFEGQSVRIVHILSFKSVYVLQLNDSLVALNEAEMSCLKF
jgi:Fe2+ transport system protein FeoA